VLYISAIAFYGGAMSIAIDKAITPKTTCLGGASTVVRRV
jgi:hypothetical protein